MEEVKENKNGTAQTISTVVSPRSSTYAHVPQQFDPHWWKFHYTELLFLDTICKKFSNCFKLQKQVPQSFHTTKFCARKKIRKQPNKNSGTTCGVSRKPILELASGEIKYLKTLSKSKSHNYQQQTIIQSNLKECDRNLHERTTKVVKLFTFKLVSSKNQN